MPWPIRRDRKIPKIKTARLVDSAMSAVAKARPIRQIGAMIRTRNLSVRPPAKTMTAAAAIVATA